MTKAQSFPIHMRWAGAVTALLMAAVAAIAAAQFTVPFGTWARLSGEPVIAPQGDGFESAGTFNPAVVKKDGKFVMLYRAQDHKGTSSLGYGTSEDGIHFVRRPEPVMVSETPYEKGGGVEDPRVVQIGDTYYLTYTGYNNVDGVGPKHKDAQLCMATSLRPGALEAARRHHARVQREVELGMDQVWRNCLGKNRR